MNERTLHVSAGGRGERIASYIATANPTEPPPKHLLPIPAPGATLLGEAVRNALPHFHSLVIWTSQDNHAYIAAALPDEPQLQVKVDHELTGPLGPMIRQLLCQKVRAYGCAGDYYCNFSWEAFERFHDSHSYPISILVAQSVPAPKGARFFCNECGRIRSWERVPATTADDWINIGCYIVDPSEEVLHSMAQLERHKEDGLFDTFTAQGLIAGYQAKERGYNVNVASVYEALVTSLRKETLWTSRPSS